MLRKALQGAAVAGAAVAFAVGAASPAMANGADYEYDPDDFGGVNVLSNFCLDISDVLDVIDVDVLTMTGGNNCEFTDSEIHANGNDVDVDGEKDGWNHHKDN
ncbi:hypothetical protein [Glycomyces tenuis]|uniref:hypothetical protein n=1 Tax=Glycomyces tenuis TaxID=58116 RepID=UPI000410E0AA|nr:hypothetical protein [Glycomyces tenuis]